MMRYTPFLASLTLFATSLSAEPPQVITDIAPVHGLVSMVMEGVGNAEVILGAGASAHDLALRPSQAKDVASADLIIWIGASLTPQLGEAFETLAPDATVVALDSLEQTQLLEPRELEDFDEAKGHDDHDHDHDHDHGAHIDPHLWLDPENAVLWLDAIALQLAALDPENAETYRANAASAISDIGEVADEITAQLSAAPQTGFLVSHDAFQYFEARFEREAIGAVSLSDAVSPSPKHMIALRQRIESANVGCVLVEPLTNTGLIDAVAGDTTLRAIEVDPLGAHLPQGAGFYPALIEHMGEAFISCAAPASRG